MYRRLQVELDVGFRPADHVAALGGRMPTRLKGHVAERAVAPLVRARCFYEKLPGESGHAAQKESCSAGAFCRGSVV